MKLFTGKLRLNRRQRLKKLADALLDEVNEVLERGHQLHGHDLRRMAISVNKKGGFWPTFKVLRSLFHLAYLSNFQTLEFAGIPSLARGVEEKVRCRQQASN